MPKGLAGETQEAKDAQAIQMLAAALDENGISGEDFQRVVRDAGSIHGPESSEEKNAYIAQQLVVVMARNEAVREATATLTTALDENGVSGEDFQRVVENAVNLYGREDSADKDVYIRHSLLAIMAEQEEAHTGTGVAAAAPSPRLAASNPSRAADGCEQEIKRF